MGFRGEGVKVCVQGLWNLGSVTAACLASVGHDVVGLDFNKGTIQGLQLNNPPISEPGLAGLIRDGQAAGRLRFLTSPAEALAGVELLWVTYDTPVDDDDNADVDFVVAQLILALPHLDADATVLVSSQMPVGSIHRLEDVTLNLCPSKL